MLRTSALALVATLAIVRPAAAEGVDFIADAKLLYRVAACGNADQPLPEAMKSTPSAAAGRASARVATSASADVRSMPLCNAFRGRVIQLAGGFRRRGC